MALAGILAPETPHDAILLAEAAGIRAGIDWRKYVYAEAVQDRQEREAAARRLLGLAAAAQGEARQKLIEEAERLRKGK